MSFNGSGTFNLYTPGNPVVTGTTISSTWANNTLSDIATGLSTCITKNGQTTVTADIPMAGFKFTGLGAGSANGNSLRYEQGMQALLTTTGDIIYASAANTPARLAASTSGYVLTANGAGVAPSWQALAAASTSAAGVVELAIQSEVDAGTDTTRAITPNLNRIALGTEQATTSGTAINFTGIPAGTRRITINFSGVSKNGTSHLLVQIGDAGGIENSGYLSVTTVLASGVTTVSSTAGFIVFSNGAGDAINGTLTLTLENAASFRWCASGVTNDNGSPWTAPSSGIKSLSAELDRVSLTTVSGDTFDAGAVNITLER